MSATRNTLRAVDSFIRRRWPAFCFFSGLLLALGTAHAATVPAGFQDIRIATGLTSPTTLTALPDGRVLAVQQNGVIRMIKGDAMLSANFWGVPSVDSGGERGCLGITPDPNFAANRFVYIYCTINTGSGSANRVIRVTEANDRMVPGSERILFQLPNVPGTTRFHMGGALRFGADGKLYIAVGNHEDSPQNPSNSQRLTNPFGKILRINADGTVPSDNPYFNTAGAYQANWNIGHRNPFAFDIQPGTGRIHIGDVGQSAWEEINNGLRGANYGWPFFEGNAQRIAPPGGFSHTAPVLAYSHSGACSITGVAFYNPQVQQFPSQYVGKLLYQDFCGGYIRTFDPVTRATAAFVTGISFPTNMVVAPNGTVYYVARNQQTGTPTPGGGSINRIIFTGSQAPRITLHPDSQTVVIGNPVTFRVAADGATSYQWRRNGAVIAGATSTTYTIASVTTADNGARFTATATNSFGSTTSSEAILTVSTNAFPVARIDTPPASLEFTADDVVNYSGGGTDAEDGTLAPSRLTWQIDFLHDSHSHPFLEPTSGVTGGSVTVPAFEVGEANTWLRFFLSATDSSNQTHTAFRDVYPRTQLSTLNPTGTPVNGFGPVERNTSNGETAAGDGRTITLAGISYAKGWGVHAPSEMRFALGGTCSGRFIADVGVDDEVGAAGSVVFQVFGDSALLFDSGIVRGTDLRSHIDVSIAGVTELRLVVTDAGDGKASDHADWAGTRVTGCSGSGSSSSSSSSSGGAVTITALSVRDTANAADWSVQSNLQVGNQTYGDRTFTFTSIPSNLLGANWLRTANDSKAFTGNPLATFSLTAAGDVYVALNNSQPVPAWVTSGGWTDTGTDLATRESATVTRTYSVFRRSFAAGATVSLGPWNSTASMYTVIVR